MPRRLQWILGPLLACGLGSTLARADQRAVRRLEPAQGLPNADVTAVAQDDDGFVWIGTNSGLARFDGETIVRWAEHEIRGRVHLVVPTTDGVLVGEFYGYLWEVSGATAVMVSGPGGSAIFSPTDALHDARGTLWVAVDDELWRRMPDGSWSSPYSACFGGDAVQRVATAPGRPLYIATTHALWRASSEDEGCPERLGEALAANDLLVTDAGDVHVLERTGRWWRLQGTRREAIHAPPMQGRALAARGEDVRRADGSVETWSRDGGMARGGSLVVDHEGSLWVGTVEGLVQYFEPDTITHSLRYGDDELGLLHITEGPEQLVVTSWRGTAMVEGEEAAPRLDRLGEEQALGPVFRERMCRDAEGTLWGSVYEADAFIVRSDGRWMTRVSGGPVRVDACSTAAAGDVWLATREGLVRTAGGAQSSAVPYPWNDGRTVGPLIEDQHGRVWLGAGRVVCSYSGHSADDDPWSCTELPERVAHLVGFIEASGQLWAGTASDGVYAHSDGAWQRLEGSNQLASQWIYSLRGSPRGGVWIAGSNVAVRVLPRPEHPDGFEVVERLGHAQGLPSNGAADILERVDGVLWVAGPAGLTRIPAKARARSLPPPRLALLRARLAGTQLESGATVDLPYEPGMLELDFAALSFVDRNRLRYRTQLSPDEDWSGPFERPTLQLFNPPPGRYAIRMAVSVDGEQWSVSPDVVRLVIAEPVYLRPWFWALVGGAAAALAYAMQRARLAVHGRLAQQRLRIAMDLHDDLGSGLGSIGLVADLLSRPEVPTRDKLGLASDIRSTASELGAALHSLVWTLRDDCDSLESLAVQLADRASMLMPGTRPRSRCDFPRSWPRIELALPVRRNLLLIAQEALHNAVRHAQAGTVTVGLGVAGRDLCQLWVEDDGIGGVDDSARVTGMGLANQRRRAKAIGATLHVGAGGNGRGTRITVTFSPRTSNRVARRAARGTHTP